MKHLTKSQIEELKNSLLEEKEGLERHFEVDKDRTEDGRIESERMSTGELSAVDNHPADLGTETFERGRDLAIDDQMNDTLDQVNAALERIENGTYGISEVSGKEIPFERLQALPFTTYLVDESPHDNVSDYRPVEEDIITPAAKGSGENRQQNTGRFDDAGAWQAVEEYGVADSPALSAQREVHNYNDLAEGRDSNNNFTESVETFAANDIDGSNQHIEQGEAVEVYEDKGEGDTELQIDEADEEVNADVEKADRRR